MKRVWSRALVALLLGLLACGPLLAAVSAAVDRTEIAMGETFRLILQADSIKIFSQPDLSALELDFEVLGTSQSSSTRLMNGDFTSTTSWTIQLAPKRPGKTSIPPIRIGKDKTDTIEIQVNHHSRSTPAMDLDDVILEAELADNTIYVGAQTLLTLRVSQAQSARIQLEEPEHEDAEIQQVNEASFQVIRGGRRYRVNEYTFAIFPTVPGELVLEPLTLAAEVMAQTPRSMLDPFFGKTERIIRRTEPLTLNVIPPPDDLPASEWLPANELTIAESWSNDPLQLKVGDSATRTIEIVARGLSAQRLPPLALPAIPGLKIYPDQASVTDEAGSRGITGHRVEKFALVATRAGSYELPAQTIRWWDVARNEAREARLPPLRFEVAPAPAGSASETPLPGEEGASAGSAPTAEPGAWYRYPLWWLVCALLLAACGTLAALWLRALAQLRALAPKRESRADSLSGDGEARAYRRLQSSCAGHKSAAIYQALHHWWQCYRQGEGGTGLNELAAGGANRALAAQAAALERDLYGGSPAGGWNPQALLDAVDAQRAQPRAAEPAAKDLPPLYPEPR